MSPETTQNARSMEPADTAAPGGKTAPPRHNPFSPRRIWAIALNTLTELARTKVFYFLFIFGIVLLGGSMLSHNFSFGEEFQMLKDVALGAIGIFSTLLAILATAMLLPRDIEDRTLYTILAKPLPRHEYILGKLLGVFLLLFISMAVMSLLFFALLAHREGVRVSQAALMYDNPDDLAAAQKQIREAAFTPGLWAGVALILLRACIVATATLLLSSFATSTLFTIVMSFTVYLIGHIQGIARQFWLESGGLNALQKIFLSITALVFPDLQMFNLVDEVVVGRGVPGPLLLKLSGLGALYIVIYLAATLALFRSKEL